MGRRSRCLRCCRAMIRPEEEPAEEASHGQTAVSLFLSLTSFFWRISPPYLIQGHAEISQSVSIVQGFVPALSALVYTCKKSLYRGAQPSHASPKWTEPVKRCASPPGCTPHWEGTLMRPLQRRPLAPLQANTLLFCRSSRRRLTATEEWLLVPDDTP